MAQNSGGNPVLQLIISAKDDASKIISQVFGALNNSANIVAGQVRDTFSSLFGGGLDSAIEFEAQLDKVQAKGGYTAETMDTLKQAAIDLGAKFGITGTEVAQGMESMAAAGLNEREVIASLPSVLALAKAESLSLDEASSKLANSLTTVGLGFDQAGRMADVLTQGANESTTSASALAAALETAGGIATTAGLSLEQTNAALTGLAKGGIEGSAAGTSLSAILTQLLNPASNASKELNKLGINTRDLGTVIGELEKQGPNAGAAILAFGETAGPGLRSLVGQGQQSLLDLEQAMLNADGAALKASDQMGGNLKGALEGLSTAWDSLKTALFDPVLEPITDAANELSTSLNTNLKDGALKPTQAAIKSFAENSIAALKDFFASFDTSEVGPKLQQFAADAKAAFDSMASGGKAAADVVTIAWNTLTAGFKTISAGLLAIASSVLGNLAVIESAAAKVGLGSIERANELNTKALEMKTRASELLTQVAQDGREIGAAYDSLTAKTDTAADAQKNLKTALPVAELQALTYTLADYQGIANKANAATAQAKADYEAGKTSGAAYASAIQAASEANYALEKATQSQTAATKSGVSQATIMKSALDAQYQAVIDNAKAAQTLTDEQLKTNVAAIKVTQAEIELAKAKGDTSRVTQLQTKLAQQEVDLAQQTAVAKLQEAAALREQLTNRLQYRASLAESNTELDREIQLLAARTLTADQEAASTAASAQAQNQYNTALDENITQQERLTAGIQRANQIEETRYDLQIQQVQAEEQLAQAKGDTATATQKENEATDLQIEKLQAATQRKQAEIQAYQELIAATQLKLAADGELDASDKNQLATMADTAEAMENERQQLVQIAEQTRELADAQKEGAEKATQATKADTEATKENTKATAGRAAGVLDLVKNLDGVTEKALEIAKAMDAGTRSSIGGVQGMMQYAMAVQEAVGYIKSTITAEEELNAKIDELNETVDGTGPAAARAQQELLYMARNGGAEIRGLSQAGEEARQKLVEIKNAALDAETALAEMAQDFTKQILQLQGDQKALLDLEQKERLQQLDDLYTKAGQLGTAEYQAAKARADELHQLKLQQLADEEAASQAQSATQKTTNDLNALADATGRVASGLKSLGEVDLSRVTSQAGQLTNYFNDLNGVL